MLSYPSRKKKSKKLFVAATAIAAVIFIGSYYLIAGNSGDKVVAKINGQKILRSEVDMRLRDIFEAQGGENSAPSLEELPKEIVEILAKEVYLEKELTKEAMQSDIAKSKEVKARIEDAKNKILRQAYIDSILKEEVTAEKINGKYLELSKDLEGKKEYQISHIVVRTKEEAEKIAQELRSKKSQGKFAELAKKHSIDQESAVKGGEIDYTLEDSMIKEIATVVTSLEKNQISDPIETKFGWHLVKVGDIRDARALSFEAVKDNIRDQLIQDRVNEINNRIINDAKIQILIRLKEISKSAEPKAETSEIKPEAAAENSDSQNSEKTATTEEKQPAEAVNQTNQNNEEAHKDEARTEQNDSQNKKSQR